MIHQNKTTWKTRWRAIPNRIIQSQRLIPCSQWFYIATLNMCLIILTINPCSTQDLPDTVGTLRIPDSQAAPQHVEDITGEFVMPQEEFRPQGEEMELTMQEAIDIALESNPQVRIAEHSVEESLANLDLTESAYKNLFDINAEARERFRRMTGGTFRVDPDKGLISEDQTQNENNTLFSVGPRYTRTFRNGSSLEVNPLIEFEHDSDAAFDRGVTNPTGSNSEDRYSINLSYNYPLNSRPREEIRTSIENSKIGAIQSDYSYYTRKKQIIDQVINTYWNIKSLELNVDIQNERLIQARRIEFINKVKYENEQISELNYNQTKVDVLNQEASLINLIGNLRSSIERFNILLGLPVDTRLKLPDELIVGPLPMSSKEYIQKVTSTNLDLKNLRLSIRRTKNNLRVARLGQQPDLVLTNFLNRSDEGDQNLGVGLVFNWNFGDGGATKARVRALEQNLEQQKINLWDLERNLVQEAYADLRNLQLQAQRIEILKINVEQAYRTFENALYMYTNFGQSTFREMQDFQIDLASNRSQLVGAKVSYNLAKSNLLLKVHDYQASDEIAPILSSLKDR